MSQSRRPARFHHPGELVPGRAVTLGAPQSHHATRVLRLKAGDAVTLFNGDGDEYAGVIAGAGRHGVAVDIGARATVDRESRLAVTLAQVVSSGERMDYTVRKAVELGVAAIQPLISSRSVVRLDAGRAARRLDHWRTVVAAACEQCGRNRVPEVAAARPLHDWLAGGAGRGDALALLLSPRAATRWRELPPPSGAVLLLAGAEGGFSAEEERAAAQAGFTTVRLGPRVLRTETAAVAALAAMQALWGDF